MERPGSHNERGDNAATAVSAVRSPTAERSPRSVQFRRRGTRILPCQLLIMPKGTSALCNPARRPRRRAVYNPPMMQHVGIVGCSAEGAALCYRTVCLEGEALLGAYDHPEVSVHTHALARYMSHIGRDDWAGVGELMLSSAHKLARAGADFLICPDNTIHQALPGILARSPRPWLHIAEVVADAAAARGWRRLGLTGTRYLVDSEVYPQKLLAARPGVPAPAACRTRRDQPHHLRGTGARGHERCGRSLLPGRLPAHARGRLRRRDTRLHGDPAHHARRKFPAADAGFNATAGARGTASRRRRRVNPSRTSAQQLTDHSSRS